MSNLEEVENQIETSNNAQVDNEHGKEVKESDLLSKKAAVFLENSDGKRSFIQTIKSFSAWLKHQLAGDN
jgi:hypothetical protein